MLCKSINQPQNLTNKAVLHGRKQEKKALAKLEEKCGLTIAQCGLMIHTDMPYLAATPDGITDNVVVEVKCPYKGRKKKIIKSAKYFPFLDTDEDNKLILKKNHNYYAQVQGQLLIAKKEVCIFVIYTLEDFVRIDVGLDHEYCERKLVPALRNFYRKHYRSFVANKL